MESLLQPRSPQNIIIVDDNEDCMEAYRLLLHGAGHSVRTSSSASVAVLMAQQETPDVVFADIAMGGVTGFDVARTLRSFSALDQTVLIAVTAHSEDPYIDEAAQSGFDYFVCKPVEANFLLECAYASKPEAMLVLSAALLQRSRVLQDQSNSLSQRNGAIREKSRQIIEAMLHRIAAAG